MSDFHIGLAQFTIFGQRRSMDFHPRYGISMRKWLFLFLVLFCTAVEASPSGDVSFTGSWSTPTDEYGWFSLDLIQTGNRIQGYHRAIALRGRRIDAVLPKEGPASIAGKVIDGVAHVRFQSGYSEDASGEALITLRNNKIEWKITKSSGAHYLPRSAVLDRQKRNQQK